AFGMFVPARIVVARQAVTDPDDRESAAIQTRPNGPSPVIIGNFLSSLERKPGPRFKRTKLW
ncbi:MAG: hypothetical protein ACT4NU_12300, partial [Chromatiales bacterium]